MGGVTHEVQRIKNSQRPEYEQMLGLLAARMRLYDDYSKQRLQLVGERDCLAEPLADINPEVPYREQPEYLAYSALAVYLKDQEIEAVEKNITEVRLQSELYPTAHAIGSRAVVTATDYERYAIGTSRRNQYGQLNGLGQFHGEVTGTITEINLDLEQGGSLQLSGVWNREYSASPLVDREADYRPAFVIRPVG